jgi:hypothetical protein
MISNERSWPYQQPKSPRVYDDSQSSQPRQQIQEDTIKTAELQVERKIFMFAFKENLRGRFLRITEESGTKHNSIIVPASGLEDFKRLVSEMVRASETLPPKNDTAEEDDSVGNR